MTDAAIQNPAIHTPVRSLAGRRALITGGTTGIGRAIAVLLASEGAAVFVCGRDPQHLADALADIRAVGTGDGITLDLAEPDAIDRFFAAGAAAIGAPDIVVLNAAVAAGGLTQMTPAAVREAIAVDFTAYLMGAKLAADTMARGDLVFTGSMSAHVLGPGSTVYAGIKAGIAGFAEALRRELGPKGIRVSLVEPGKTKADLSDETDAEQRAKVAAEETLRAADIAVGVHYLLTQPERVVVQQLTIVPRAQGAE